MSVNNEQFDVVVIGAGLGGLHCAQLLGEQGARVLLVDRKRALDEAVHTTGIFVRRTLEDFALPEDCLGPPVRHVTLYSPARRALSLESPFDEFRVGRMSKLYLRRLAECQRAGVVWSPSTRYAGSVEAAQSSSLVRLESDGRGRAVRARFVVGADGARSRVARDLGLHENREWIVGVEEVLTGVPLTGPPRFHCFLDPRLAPGYLAWLVHDGEEVHLGVGGYAARFNPVLALGEFREVAARVVDLRGATVTERRGGRIPVGGVLRRIANSRGLLVGDAAGAVSPLTAGGLDPCLRLSGLAARVITNYLATGDPTALAPYSGDAFRARFVSRLWMRRALKTLTHPRLLELSCAAMRLPIFKQLAWHVFFGRGSFPDVESATATQPVAARESAAFGNSID